MKIRSTCELGNIELQHVRNYCACSAVRKFLGQNDGEGTLTIIRVGDID